MLELLPVIRNTFDRQLEKFQSFDIQGAILKEEQEALVVPPVQSFIAFDHKENQISVNKKTLQETLIEL